MQQALTMSEKSVDHKTDTDSNTLDVSGSGQTMELDFGPMKLRPKCWKQNRIHFVGGKTIREKRGERVHNELAMILMA